MPLNTLTQKELMEVLTYIPETGEMIRHKGFRAGVEARAPSTNGYVRVVINGQRYLKARLAHLYVVGEWPQSCIDHIDGDKTNNAWHNLRPVTHRENSQNMKIHKRNTSRVPGVGWKAVERKWHANITVNYKTTYLGSHSDWFEAVCARKSAEAKHGFHPNHGRLAAN